MKKLLIILLLSFLLVSCQQTNQEELEETIKTLKQSMSLGRPHMLDILDILIHKFQFCEKWQGKEGVTMPDLNKAGCITDKMVWETGFARNWKDVIGKVLNSAYHTNKKPGIVLILREKTDSRYEMQLRRVTESYNLKIKIVTIEWLKKPVEVKPPDQQAQPEK